MGPVLLLPLALFAPLQLLLAKQDDGLLLAFQLIVAADPVPIESGLTASVTTGFDAATAPEATATVVVAELLPPALSQVSV